MKYSRIKYRYRQLKLAIGGKPSNTEIEEVSKRLNKKQLKLFQQMQPSEQMHAILVCQQLIYQGHNYPDLLVAALLHDIGKTRYPLNTPQRILIVIAYKFFTKWVKKINYSAPIAWKRPFLVSEKHADWGAEMAALCDTTVTAINLIRRHQTKLSGKIIELEDQLLLALQQADNQN